MTFKAEPKNQNPYPKLLNEFEKKRHQGWTKPQGFKQQNFSVKALDAKRLQMFSGKRGK